ncbi:TolC family protein [Tateyamaria sp. SN6-1]|uniref:TolC family protein n=1 Tax=Tateyamaria sp. SN6-1 TaxID=3092148 RepID=UPI0039F4B5E9
MGQGSIKVAALCAALTLQAGCDEALTDNPVVAKLGAGIGTRVAPETGGVQVAALAQTPTKHDETLNAESVVLQNLLARRSVLPSGSAYDRVSTAVLAANARAAETELRAARLRAAAASKNWLPTVGPSISLNSLGDLISQIVVDAVLFDNGRKKGERAFAKADVEVAAVALAEDTNDRVSTALGLYLDAAQAREAAALHRATLKDMQHFEWVMSERVRGGVSDMSDLNVIRAKLSEIRAATAAAEEAQTTAIAELNAMAISPLDDVRGIDTLRVEGTEAQPLTVTRAEAEKHRSIAQARIERASQLPGIGAQATIGENGGAGITVGGPGLGLGTPARLRAIEAAQEAAGRQVAQANEDANRTLRRLEGDVAATARQAGEARHLTQGAKANLDLFQEQYKGGQRQVMDVIGVYETFAARQEAELALKYDALRLQIELARVQGVLADGDQI